MELISEHTYQALSYVDSVPSISTCLVSESLHRSPSRQSFCECGRTSINYIPTVKQCKICSLQMGLETVMGKQNACSGKN